MATVNSSFVLSSAPPAMARQRQHEPMENREFISIALMNWLESESNLYKPKLIVFLETIFSLSRPTNPCESIATGAVRHHKLHDREPKVIVRELEKKDPTF